MSHIEPKCFAVRLKTCFNKVYIVWHYICYPKRSNLKEYCIDVVKKLHINY